MLSGCLLGDGGVLLWAYCGDHVLMGGGDLYGDRLGVISCCGVLLDDLLGGALLDILRLGVVTLGVSSRYLLGGDRLEDSRLVSFGDTPLDFLGVSSSLPHSSRYLLSMVLISSLYCRFLGIVGDLRLRLGEFLRSSRCLCFK